MPTSGGWTMSELETNLLWSSSHVPVNCDLNSWASTESRLEDFGYYSCSIKSEFNSKFEDSLAFISEDSPTSSELCSLFVNDGRSSKLYSCALAECRSYNGTAIFRKNRVNILICSLSVSWSFVFFHGLAQVQEVQIYTARHFQAPSPQLIFAGFACILQENRIDNQFSQMAL